MNRRGKFFIAATPLVLLPVLSGCWQQARGVPLDNQDPITATFAAQKLRLVDHYLVLPVTAERKKSDGRFFSLGSSSGGSAVFSGSAWSGPGFDRFTAFDFEVVELDSGQHFRVFSRYVAAALWNDASYSEKRGTGNAERLRFAGQLILSARTQDVDGNGYIDAKDPIWMYSYDLLARKLQRISPEGYHLLNAHLHGDQILMVLCKQDHRKSTAAFSFSPSTKLGEFKVEGMMP